jgi:hypothetical protein
MHESAEATAIPEVSRILILLFCTLTGTLKRKGLDDGMALESDECVMVY